MINRAWETVIVELDDEFLRELSAPVRVLEFRDAREEYLILRAYPSGELAYYLQGRGCPYLFLGHTPPLSLESARCGARAYAHRAGAEDGYAKDLRTLEAWERSLGQLVAN